MLTYRHVNASWLFAGAFCRTHHLVRADAPISIASLDCHDSSDAAAIPRNAAALADTRASTIHLSHQTTIDPRFLALRLRW
jgi:hypothetical protein